MLLLSNTLLAQTWTSQTDGNWEDNSTWSNADDIANYGAAGGDLAIINDTVTINGNFTFGWRDDLTINSGGLLIVEGDLTFNSWFADIAVNAGGGLIVDGDLNMDDKADFNVDGLVVVLEDVNINIDGDGDLEDADGQIYVMGNSNVTNCPGCNFSPEDEATLAANDPEFMETVNERYWNG
ncbi:unnamed protein product [Symbiodinium microadriaticum]|nr:unnamed protein product [Symbiodinium microadriaticum]